MFIYRLKELVQQFVRKFQYCEESIYLHDDLTIYHSLTKTRSITAAMSQES